jgi:glucokinase
MKKAKILAGDVGGTNTRLAWCEVSQRNRIDTLDVEIYPSQEFASLDAIVRRFVEEHPRSIGSAAFGVAGPVRDGRSKISNLTWEVNGQALAEMLEVPRVVVANDLEVTAYGIASLGEKDFVVLNPGDPDPQGNEALIAAGTGLGEAGLHWEGDYHRPFATEGGHSDFAPRDELECDLLLYLAREQDHVSYERVVSGPGLVNIYRFYRDSGRAEEPASLRDELQEGDAAPVIARHGLSGEHEICVLALERFASLYGAEAGNLALKLLATSGLFVGGGIAPKILPRLEDGTFFESFTRKGRMSALLQRVPVRVIQNDRCALFGAARLAYIESKEAES